MDEARAPEPAGDRSPVVSVIVPVRDNAVGIRDLIRRLAGQTIPRSQFEVVIGDDGSEPASLAGLETSDGWLRIAPGPRLTSYAARNRAVTVARGSVLAFCDSDCLPEPAWLEEGLAALADADIVDGEVRYTAPARPTVWSLLTIDMYLDQQNNALLSRGVTANLFVDRRLFDQAGGFDESLPSGGDYDFVARCAAAGARLAYAPAAVVWHPTLDSRQEFLLKVRRTNRWATTRRSRAGERIGWRIVEGFLPVRGVARARRQALRPAFRLQSQRFEASGIALSRWRELRALVTLYVVVGNVAATARTRGWIEGRRRVTESARPRSAAAPEGPEVVTAQANDGIL